jgi:hypothetical protein
MMPKSVTRFSDKIMRKQGAMQALDRLVQD